MISSSIPVSFLYCCLFFLPCSDNLLSVLVERGILHRVWRVAGLFSGEAKLGVLSKGHSVSEAEIPQEQHSVPPHLLRCSQAFPRGEPTLAFPRGGITDPALFYREMNKWKRKEEHSRQPCFITFWFSHPELQSDSKHCYLCVLGGVKHSFKDILKAVIGSLCAVDFSNRAELTSQYCITERDQVYFTSKNVGPNRW